MRTHETHDNPPTESLSPASRTVRAVAFSHHLQHVMGVVVLETAMSVLYAAGDVCKEFKKTGQFVSDLQICCHFTTHNSATALKTNDETITFLVCLFVLSEQLVLSLTLTMFDVAK